MDHTFFECNGMFSLSEAWDYGRGSQDSLARVRLTQ